MNQLEAGEAPEAAHGRSDLQEELGEVLRPRAVISAVLRAMPIHHTTCSPIFDTILDSANDRGWAILRWCAYASRSHGSTEWLAFLRKSIAVRS
jgi:hypothetical protein